MQSGRVRQEGEALQSEVSPCGRWLALLEDGGVGIDLIIRSVDDGRSVRAAELGSIAGGSLLLCGRDGVYVTEARGDDTGAGDPRRTIWFTYDGSTRRELLSRGELVDESPDGSLVLVAECDDEWWRHEPCRFEVRDARNGSRICSIDDGTRRRAFLAGQPPRLVCLSEISGDSYRTWFAEMVELRDPSSGVLLRTVDLTPPVGDAPVVTSDSG
jgi:hypothetical protein